MNPESRPAASRTAANPLSEAAPLATAQAAAAEADATMAIEEEQLKAAVQAEANQKAYAPAVARVTMEVVTQELCDKPSG